MEQGQVGEEGTDALSPVHLRWWGHRGEILEQA